MLHQKTKNALMPFKEAVSEHARVMSQAAKEDPAPKIEMSPPYDKVNVLAVATVIVLVVICLGSLFF